MVVQSVVGELVSAAYKRGQQVGVVDRASLIFWFMDTINLLHDAGL